MQEKPCSGPAWPPVFRPVRRIGHCLMNRSGRDAVYLEVGDRRPGDEVTYPDVDLAAIWRDGGRVYIHKDGRLYSVPAPSFGAKRSGRAQIRGRALRAMHRHARFGGQDGQIIGGRRAGYRRGAPRPGRVAD